MRDTFIVHFILMLMLIVVSGCGSQRKDDDGAENIENIVQSDTAAIDGATPEQVSVDGSAIPVDASTPVVGDAATPAQTEAPVIAAGSSTPEVPPQQAPVAASGEMAEYSVQQGDTLMKIAFELYGDISQWRALYESNRDHLKDANRLASGMTLKYERPATAPNIERNGEQYLIKQGDTLGTIAQDVYAERSKWKKIYENNKTLIKDPNKIYAGFYLYYQITEEEKRAVEEMKGKKDGGQQLGTTENLPDSAAVKTVPKDPVATKGAGGLNDLTAPTAVEPTERAPASSK